MTTCTQVEEKLLVAANASNLTAIVDIVSRMSPKEKEAINPITYDIVLFSISHSAHDQLEKAYATMMYVRHVGHYISPATVNALLNNHEQATPFVSRRRAVEDSDAQLKTQAAV